MVTIIFLSWIVHLGLSGGSFSDRGHGGLLMDLFDQLSHSSHDSLWSLGTGIWE
jgi:hypothetical protein